MDGPRSFSECEAITDDRPIRQGDIFRPLSPSPDPFLQHGLIVTADCDLAFEKHRGVLSYVPVLSLPDYLATFFLPGRVERACKPLREELLKQMRQFQAQCRQDFPEPLSDDVALEWLSRVNAESIVEELNVPGGKAREGFVDKAQLFRASTTALIDGRYGSLTESLVTLRSQATPRERVLEKLKDEIQANVKRLPGDAFFIGSLSPDFAEGHVGYLRLVREIRQEVIAVRQSDLRDASVLAVRVSRLASPYLYRLTQQLGGVFSDIGLPTNYEEARGEVVGQILDRCSSSSRGEEAQNEGAVS